MLSGKLIAQKEHYIIINVSGVGYKVFISPKTHEELPKINNAVRIFSYLNVKEDALELFGFSEIADLKLFENLIGVSGVGPRTAMSIFSTLTREEIINAVLKGDTGVFMEIPRLGKKNAQKIIIELKNKLGDTSSLDLTEADSAENKEILGVLKSFGFSTKEAHEAIKNVDSQANTTEEKIKLALKYLGK